MEIAQSRWLQTEYPVTLAEQLIDSWQKPSQNNKVETSATLRMYKMQQATDTCFYLPDMWQTDDALMMQWCQTCPPGGLGQKRWVRISAPFMTLIDRVAPAICSLSTLASMLFQIAACTPAAKHVFSGAYVFASQAPPRERVRCACGLRVWYHRCVQVARQGTLPAQSFWKVATCVAKSRSFPKTSNAS